MWLYRMMMSIPGTEYMCDNKVLEYMETKRQLISSERDLKFLRYITWKMACKKI